MSEDRDNYKTELALACNAAREEVVRRKPGGRYTVLTPEVRSRVCQAIEQGNYIDTAARLAGVGSSTVLLWMQIGRDSRKKREAREPISEREERCLEFLEAVEESQSVAEAADLTVISTAASFGDWKAAAWKLERSKPARWGPRVQVTVQQELNSVITKLESELDANTFERVLGIIASEASGATPGGAPPGEAENEASGSPRLGADGSASVPETEPSRAAGGET